MIPDTSFAQYLKFVLVAADKLNKLWKKTDSVC